MRHKIPIYVALIAVVLIAVFMAQNADVLELRFLFWTFTTRRSFMLLIFLGAGAVLGWVLMWYVQGKWGRLRQRNRAEAKAEQLPPAEPNDG